MRARDVRQISSSADIASLVHVEAKVLTTIERGVAATRLSLCLPLLLAGTACNRAGNSTQDSTTAQSAQSPREGSPVTVRGSVVSVSGNQLVIKVDTGTVNVTMTQPFGLYTRVASDLSNVKEGTFIGVTTVKQADGSERATEIHIFPEALRGTGEGSRMMAPNPGSSASRMTNGNVSTSRMTNGAVSQSRMSNGNVSSTNGSNLVVQYAGGSQNVTVPANTPVTELKAAARSIAPGDQVAVLAKKAPDGSLTADKAISTAR